MASKYRLVIGEDHQGARRALFLLLNPDFDVVAIASDGQEALESAQKYCPDVVLLDIRMPVMSGLMVARKLKAESPHQKIVFVTTFSDEAYIQEALRIGVDGYVLKSSIASDLKPALERVLSGGRCYPAAETFHPCI